MSTGEQVTRFIRCPHCGSFHLGDETICAATGKSLQSVVAPAAPKLPAQLGVPPPDLQPLEVSAESSPVPSLGGSRMVLDGRYRILGVVGQGGMGTVYEAEQLVLSRRVAVKVLHRAQKGRRESVERFQREARAASSIGHPNICEIYDVGRLSDGRPYMVMELLRGTTLADRIDAEGALPIRDCVDIMMQALSALVAAHDKAIIHRDIKPENVFLAERVGCPAVVKILDFGIHKTRDEDSLSLTRDGTIMGTPYYMAPEQARGDAIDHRIDLFACGVMLYEMVTGRRPFEGDDYHALMRSILHDAPTPPSTFRSDIPEALDTIIRRALEKDPSLRYPNATAFLVELDALQTTLGNIITGALRPVPELRRDLATYSSAEPSTQDPVEVEISVDLSEVSVDQPEFSLEVSSEIPVSIGMESMPATTEPAAHAPIEPAARVTVEPASRLLAAPTAELPVAPEPPKPHADTVPPPTMRSSQFRPDPKSRR